MFTREDHDLIAQVLWSIRLKHYPSELPQKAYEHIARALADRFQTFDPDFARDRFYQLSAIDE